MRRPAHRITRAALRVAFWVWIVVGWVLIVPGAFYLRGGAA